jgi:AAA domain, putative AbiEii toxin, Type IV TA system/AAA domain
VRFLSAAIRNYKGYMDSGRAEFGRGFNVLVGQNNSGKTAFLEALQFARFQSKPHRNIDFARETPLSPVSECEVEIELTGRELRNMLLSRGGQFQFPLNCAITTSETAVAALEALLRTHKTVIRFVCQPNNTYRGLTSPSHGLFNTEGSDPLACGLFVPSVDRSTFKFDGSTDFSADNIGVIVAQDIAARGGIYVFRAERLNVGISDITTDRVLAPDAANLPSVLMILMSNPARYERFIGYVKAIFPTIHTVTATPIGGNRVQIQIWQVDPTTERDDLAVDLTDSGTGVGQVLAILYVSVMSDAARTIVIDEPNTFLHPGAARKLIEILKSFEQHQYIISTHSLEMIRIADPSTFHLTQWTGKSCVVSRVDTQEVSEIRRAFVEVGARLSDVFGSDAVLWVEGPTEQECLPKILRKLGTSIPLGTSIVAVRSTGEIGSTRPTPRAMWEIYRRISSASAFLPTTIAIILDREARSQSEMDDLTRESKGLIKFLPRRTYENYLIDMEAITAVLNQLPAFQDAGIEVTTVEKWLADHAEEHRYFSPVNTRTIDDPQWPIDVNAPRFLADLFSELSETRETYRKMDHSIAITEWLLEHKKGNFGELIGFLNNVLGT